MKSMYITADAATAIRHRNPSIAPKSMHTTKKMKKITAAAVGMTMTTKATPMSIMAAAVAAAKRSRKSAMTTRMTLKWQNTRTIRSMSWRAMPTSRSMKDAPSAISMTRASTIMMGTRMTVTAMTASTKKTATTAAKTLPPASAIS